MKKYSNVPEITVYVILALFVLQFFARPITVFGGDLGRILKEGELFLTKGLIIQSNYFSYTMPDHPVVNYHFLAATTYYLAWLSGGFVGLHLFIIALQLIPVSIYLRYIRRNNKCYISWFLLSLFLTLPLLSIAPQTDTFAYSIAFSTLFLYCIHRYLDNKLSLRSLFIIIPLLQICWVNAHIYYWLGWLIILFGLIQTFITSSLQSKRKPLSLLFLVVLVVSVLNPQFIQAWVAPIDMLSGNFPMLPKTLQSLFVASTKQPSYLFSYLLGLGLCTLVLIFFFLWKNTAHGIFIGLFALLCICWGVGYVKNSAFLVLAACIVLPQTNIDIQGKAFWLNYRSPSLTLYILLPLWLAASLYRPFSLAGTWGIGHEKHNFSSLKFFKDNQLKGNMLSNYDIAGYLIWGLYPNTKIYIVNRPDAQSDEFYEQAYFPKIQSNAYWHKLKDISNLNIIYFKLTDETEDNLLFLGKRLDDGEWAIVYQYENKEVIMLRRLPQYEEIINKYEIKPES